MSLRKGSLILSIRLFSILLEDNAGVVSAEAERVAQGRTNGTLLCLVESIVERVVDLRVLVLLVVVDGRGNDVLAHGLDASKEKAAARNADRAKEKFKERGLSR